MYLEFPDIKITAVNWDLLTELLGKLSLEHQVMFAASISERTLPVYTSIDFPGNFNHKTLPILRESLDYIWNFSAAGNSDPEKLQKFLTICQKITSEIEENELCCSVESTAPYSIVHTLELCLTGEVKYLEEVFSGGQAMLWQLLELLMDNEAYLTGKDAWSHKSCGEQYNDINNHNYSKQEIQKEKDDWQILSNTSTITTEFIQQFRLAANPNGYGSIDWKSIRQEWVRRWPE
jgi:Protein of unknown function (DUF416)